MPVPSPLDERLNGSRRNPTSLQELPLGIAVLDTQLRFCTVNGPMAAMNGRPAAEHIGRRLDEVLPPPLGSQAGEVVRRVLTQNPTGLEASLRGHTAGDRDREHEWLLSCQPLWGEGAALNGVLLTVRDLTAEQDRLAAPAPAPIQADAEDMSRRVLDSLLAFVTVLDPQGTLLEINRAPLELCGLHKQDVLGLKFWECPWWQHDPALPAQLREYGVRAGRGESIRVELNASRPDGALLPLDFVIAPLRDRQGRITHLVNSALDISDRKRSEEALRASARLFRSVVESAPNGLAMVNEHGQMTLLNSKMEDLFGYERGELLGRSIDVLVPAALREQHAERRTEYHGDFSPRPMASRREIYAHRKDGSQFPVEVDLVPVNTPEGPQTIAAVMDVSEYKQAQRALECALRQQTALLHEVHHRVKNNLQVISSLLSLQAKTAGPEAREVLAESQSRVKAMALTHQLLYEREDFSNVHMGLYLQRLVELLRQGHAGQRRDIEVAVDADGGELLLDLQRALPCALLVTELVINAFKHAFPPHRPGRLKVSLRREGEHDAVIEVADDGVGIPPSVEVGKAQSLGFQLLPMLADQIGAQLTLHREQGSRFTVRLPLDLPQMENLDDAEQAR